MLLGFSNSTVFCERIPSFSASNLSLLQSIVHITARTSFQNDIFTHVTPLLKQLSQLSVATDAVLQTAFENLTPINVLGCFSSAPLSVVSPIGPFSISQIYSSFSWLCALVNAFLFTWSLEEGRRMQLSAALSRIPGHLGHLSHLYSRCTRYYDYNKAFISVSFTSL